MAFLFRGALGTPATDALPTERPTPGPGAAGVVVVGLALLAGFLAGFDLGATTLAGVVALFLFERREPREAIGQVDGSLLLFFAGLFVAVEGFSRSGLPDRAWATVAPLLSLDTVPGLAALTATLAVGSNVVSNVPLVLLVGHGLAGLGHPDRAWMVLGFVTTVAGNLTLVGSVANIIVAEQARGEYELGFFEYLRVGFPSTILVLAAGVPVLVWCT